MKKIKLIVNIEVFEEKGIPFVEYNIKENGATMQDMGLLLYKIKQIEKEFIDRDWNQEGEGYEIEY